MRSVCKLDLAMSGGEGGSADLPRRAAAALKTALINCSHARPRLYTKFSGRLGSPMHSLAVSDSVTILSNKSQIPVFGRSDQIGMFMYSKSFVCCLLSGLPKQARRSLMGPCATHGAPKLGTKAAPESKYVLPGILPGARVTKLRRPAYWMRGRDCPNSTDAGTPPSKNRRLRGASTASTTEQTQIQ